MPDPGDPRAALRRAALALLQQRPYTVERLTRVLRRRRAGVADVDAVVAELCDGGLLDDEAFARGYVELHAGQRGARRIARELRQRGVDGEIVARVLDEAGPADEWADAEALLRASAARYAGLPRPVALRRAAGFLARRGYSAEVVHEVVRAVIGELDEGGDG